MDCLKLLLKQKGIRWECGLKEIEIVELENLYNIAFSDDWKEIYSKMLPVGLGFYNWRDKSESNVAYIKEIMQQPYLDVLENYNEIQWNSDWGDMPNSDDEKFLKIKLLLKNAPKLIPIYEHRYLPAIKKAPVISVHNIDIIYYGENLIDYFFIEFGLKDWKNIDFNNIHNINFWMDDLY
ncbi:hypothetical protein J7S27_03385 [Carnobacteriaceae bacterium zg-C25]|nr:hypothetical protein J7S27_03385 [Carnobacteriaceae bacterium zg-C25]